jgi:hypothetical protein
MLMSRPYDAAMSDITPTEVRDALVAVGITGPHQSHSRSATIGKIQGLIDGDPDKTFGLSGADRYSAHEILAFMAELTGCDKDIACLDIDDLIDPDLTVAGLIAAGERLRDHARSGGSLFVATGHPTGMLETYIRVADAFGRAGGKLVRLREEELLPIGRKGHHAEVRYTGNVGCLADWGTLKHTHTSEPMEALLEERPWPDLVLADHGFAGAAIERGIPTIAIMDINDHALAVAKAEHRDVLIVPLDDNRPPRLYEPAWRLLEQIIERSET